jgi:hypothetical protein
MVNRVRIHVTSDKKSVSLRKLNAATLSPTRKKSMLNADLNPNRKKEPRAFTTKKIVEHQMTLDKTNDKSQQHSSHKVFKKSFYQSHNVAHYNTSTNFLRRSKTRYEVESNPPKVKSELPDINIFQSSLGLKSEKTHKPIGSSQIMKSGASIRDIHNIRKIMKSRDKK